MPAIGIKLEIVADDTKLLCDEKQCPYIRRHERDSHVSFSCVLFQRTHGVALTDRLQQANPSQYGGGPVLRMGACHTSAAAWPYARAEQVKVGDVIYDIGVHASRPHKVLEVYDHEKTYQVALLLELLETDGVSASMWRHSVTTWKNTCVRIREND